MSTSNRRQVVVYRRSGSDCELADCISFRGEEKFKATAKDASCSGSGVKILERERERVRG